MVATGQVNTWQQCQCSFETAVRKISCTQIRPAFHTLVGRFIRMGLPSNGFSNNHWALSVSVTIPRRHSKQRPGSSYEGEESDQRFELQKPFSDSFGRRCRLIGTALNTWQRRSFLRRFLCWALPPMVRQCHWALIRS